MFGRRKKGPDKTFIPSEGCRILAADPDVEIPWNEVEACHWRAECVCTIEYYTEPFVDDRVRLDQLDPATSRHAGECEFAAETDPAMLKVLLKVRDGAGRDYWWVECGACACGWQGSALPRRVDRRPAATRCGSYGPVRLPGPNWRGGGMDCSGSRPRLSRRSVVTTLRSVSVRCFRSGLSRRSEPPTLPSRSEVRTSASHSS